MFLFLQPLKVKLFFMFILPDKKQLMTCVCSTKYSLVSKTAEWQLQVNHVLSKHSLIWGHSSIFNPVVPDQCDFKPISKNTDELEFISTFSFYNLHEYNIWYTEMFCLEVCVGSSIE